MHHCQLSFPTVSADTDVAIDDGVQGDGLHVIGADAPVGVTVTGFGRGAGYAIGGEASLWGAER